MKPALLQFFTKDSSKLDGASQAARQRGLEGLHESKVCFSAATPVQPSRAHFTAAFHLAKPQQQQSCFSPDSSILCERALCLLCLRKGWLPSPCHPHSHPSAILSQILGMGFIYCLAIPGINLSFPSVTQELLFSFYLTRYSISCYFFSFVFFMRGSSARFLNVFGLFLHFLTSETQLSQLPVSFPLEADVFSLKHFWRVLIFCQVGQLSFSTIFPLCLQ